MRHEHTVCHRLQRRRFHGRSWPPSPDGKGGCAHENTQSYIWLAADANAKLQWTAMLTHRGANVSSTSSSGPKQKWFPYLLSFKTSTSSAQFSHIFTRSQTIAPGAVRRLAVGCFWGIKKKKRPSGREWLVKVIPNKWSRGQQQGGERDLHPSEVDVRQKVKSSWKVENESVSNLSVTWESRHSSHDEKVCVCGGVHRTDSSGLSVLSRSSVRVSSLLSRYLHNDARPFPEISRATAGKVVLKINK